MAAARKKKEVPASEAVEHVVDTVESQAEGVQAGDVEPIGADALVTEPTPEPTPEPAQEEPAATPVITQVIKLSVHENKVIAVPAGASKVVIENTGGGDLYVNPTAISFKSTNLVAIGDSREFTGVDKLFVSAASRPTFRVSIYL